MRKILLFTLSVIVGFLAVNDSDATSWICNLSGISAYSSDNCFVETTSTGWVFVSVETETDPINISTKIQTVSSGYTITVYNNGDSFLFAPTVYWTDSIGIKGATGSVWATWSTWTQGIPWPQGNDGYSAYELAQINGFTGSEIEWFASLVGPMGATGETVHQVIFSSGAEIFSGATFTIDGNNWNFASGELYIPLSTTIDGTTYLNTDRVKQMTMQLLFFVLVGGAFWYFIIRKILWRQKEEHF